MHVHFSGHPDDTSIIDRFTVTDWAPTHISKQRILFVNVPSVSCDYEFWSSFMFVVSAMVYRLTDA
jgi:hypothetical protein